MKVPRGSVSVAIRKKKQRGTGRGQRSGKGAMAHAENVLDFLKMIPLKKRGMDFRRAFALGLLGLTGLAAYADSQIPLRYVPRRVRAAIQDYVPGAELTKAEIGNDDEWGTKYRCEYYRGGHQGKIQVSERGRLLDLDEDLNPEQLPPKVRRAVARESRGGAIRRAHLDGDRGRMVFSAECFYGMSSAKVKLKVLRDGTIIGRDFD